MAITTIGTKLRKLRALNQMSTQTVKRQTLLPINELILFETEEAYPDQIAIMHLAQLYKVDEEKLIDDAVPMYELINLNDYFADVPVLVPDKTEQELETELKILSTTSSRQDRLRGIMALYNYDADSLTEATNLTVPVSTLLALPTAYDKGTYLVAYLQLSKAFNLDPDYFIEGKTMTAETNEPTAIEETPQTNTEETETPVAAAATVIPLESPKAPKTVRPQKPIETPPEVKEALDKLPTIGERLKWLRLHSDYKSATKVAAASNQAFSNAVLRNMENNLTALSPERRNILAQLYGVNPDILSLNSLVGMNDSETVGITTPTPEAPPTPSAPITPAVTPSVPTAPVVTPTETTTSQSQRGPSKTLRLTRIFNLAEELFANPNYTEQDLDQLLQTLSVLHQEA